MLHATRPIRVLISHIIRGRFERRRSLESYSFKNRCAKVGGSHQHPSYITHLPQELWEKFLSRDILLDPSGFRREENGSSQEFAEQAVRGLQGSQLERRST